MYNQFNYNLCEEKLREKRKVVTFSRPNRSTVSLFIDIYDSGRGAEVSVCEAEGSSTPESRIPSSSIFTYHLVEVYFSKFNMHL